ncbi:MAG TPA: aquaporin [Gemmatimonadales bacterium]|nr:aquaporin [Gemmatimonadales bacterium]
MNYRSLRAPVAEFVGTLLFVLVGAGSVASQVGGIGGNLGVALANGLGLAIAVTIMMPISGGHLNPAVSVALWIGNQIDAKTLGRYVAAQLLGAITAALLIKAVFPASMVRITSLGTPSMSGAMGFFDGVVLEALFTFFLVSAVYGTAVSPQAQRVGGFAIGLTVVVCALGGGALTGAALNPARAFGPALVSWDWHGQAVYWIGPLLGAAAAGALWKYLLLPRSATDLT